MYNRFAKVQNNWKEIEYIRIFFLLRLNFCVLDFCDNIPYYSKKMWRATKKCYNLLFVESFVFALKYDDLIFFHKKVVSLQQKNVASHKKNAIKYDF